MVNHALSGLCAFTNLPRSSGMAPFLRPSLALADGRVALIRKRMGSPLVCVIERSARGERPADELVQEAHPDVGVPLVAVGAGGHLAEIEADDAPAALH